jgi:2-polyprenyl-3-methyl-5-hydroxy-6-metoxy-1,4-benzoquinol methylase
MTKEMWNKRYARTDFVYDTVPNEFFKQQLLKLTPGKILLPAEGEGRNAVFAAKKGWKVDAFDSSIEALKKAEKWAKKNNVPINYQLSTYDEVDYPNNFFDALAFIYAHSLTRSASHKKMLQFLKPKGTIILEGFCKKQIHNSSGGPKNIDMLFSAEEIFSDFTDCTDIKIWQEDIELNENIGHSGKASVIRLISRK